MKKLSIAILLSVFSIQLFAQEVPVVINHATIHTGVGTVIPDGMIIIHHGNLEYVGPVKDAGYDLQNVSVIDATGKQVYPGFIALNSQVGLKEIEAARATVDYSEVGTYNPNIRAEIAFNTDSKVLPTLRTNGILIAQTVPEAGVVQGQSSIMKMAGWNWEDAAIQADDNMHMHWPGAYAYNPLKNSVDVNPDYQHEVNDIISFFNQAKAYCAQKDHTEKNLRFEAMRKLFSGQQKLFVSANQAKEIIGAIDFADNFGLHLVIVGGRESYRVLDLLKEKQIPVLIEATHELPNFEGDAVDLPYRLPSILTNAGILCGLTMSNTGSDYWNVRNLPFEAGTAAAYGLTKEQALALITMNNAKIAGIDQHYGTLETGKSATLIITNGDALDMRTSIVSNIFINGERFDPWNWQNDLAKKFMLKYNIVR